jgi:hypothetical protein
LVWAAIQQARTATRRHYEQTRTDQQRRLTESFSKAVEQLASDKVEARLGGIYTLERVAIEAIAQVRGRPSASDLYWWRRRRLRRRLPSLGSVSDLYWPVMETLTAFVRERVKWQEQAPAGRDKSDYLFGSDAQSKATTPAAEPSTDIAAVLTVIGGRPDAGRFLERTRGGRILGSADQRGWRLDLNSTDLRGADLAVAHLERANLRGAHLEGAFLSLAHLQGANLRGAYLEGANLSGAHLEGSNLNEAYGDARTRLPDGVARPPHWPPYDPDAR